MKAFSFFLVYILACVISMPNQSQTGFLFKKTSHSFDSIEEEGGKVQVSFFFKNEGLQTTKITAVNVSCGCTSPIWPKQSIAPGDTGSVIVTYDPMFRPGFFEKFIRVQLDNAPEITLTIRGNVIPRTLGIDDWFPFSIGNLRFRQKHMIMGFINSDTVANFQNVVYNSSEKPIAINWEQSIVPEFISINTKGTETIAPKDSLLLELTYDATKLNKQGFRTDSLSLVTNDSDQPQKHMIISTYLKQIRK